MELEKTKRELKAARILNKAAAALIVVQLVIMGMMLHSLNGWAAEFAHLQQQYEELGNELPGGDFSE